MDILGERGRQGLSLEEYVRRLRKQCQANNTTKTPARLDRMHNRLAQTLTVNEQESHSSGMQVAIRLYAPSDMLPPIL